MRIVGKVAMVALLLEAVARPLVNFSGVSSLPTLLCAVAARK